MVVLALDKLLRVSKAEQRSSREVLEEVRTTTRKTIEWARELEQTAKDGKADDDETNESLRRLLQRVESAVTMVDETAAMAATMELARSLNVDLPFVSHASFSQFVNDGGPVWKLGGQRPSRASGPTKRALTHLGSRCQAPTGESARSLLLTLTANRDVSWTRPMAGTHVSIRRPAGYSHHGLLMGDGSVVDYAGEPTIGGLKEAAVRRTTLEQFLAGQLVSDLQRCVVTTDAGLPLATMLPGVSSLRAAESVGMKGYNPASNNCEHFASWALLGMPFSGQVKGVMRFASDLGAPGVASAVDEVLDGLGYCLRTETQTIDAPVLGTETILPLPIDIGRAYWAEDRQEFVIWMPLWGESGRPLGGPDRPWSLGPLRGADDWQASAPTLVRDQGWHASLIAIPREGPFWLTNEGEWLQESSDVLELIEGRLAPSVRVLLEMNAAPGRLASKLASLVAG